MPDIIKLLPDSVANQIAAGEVIQRPASVVKELVENAIDAGATRINIIIKDAGKTSIQITDNGKGMSDTDARMAFERHATSKITTANDLFALHTKGFRGEALASIAAIAQVELKTRVETDDIGSRIYISGSVVEKQERIAAAVGTTILVKNLFFNVPVRRKFLKSNSTEFRYILQETMRIAMVAPELSFTLVHNDDEVLNLASGNYRQRIVSVMGKKMNNSLLSLDVTTSVARIAGFIGRPESARKKSGEQYFFVNDRYMRHPYFHKAVMEAFSGLLLPETMPSYFIYLTVDPESIDVNIHPTKTEIKFENEHAIWPILMAVVKEALGKFSAGPSIDFDQAGAIDIPILNSSTEIKMPTVAVDATFNPFQSAKAQGGGFGSYKKNTPEDWEKLYKGFESALPEEVVPETEVQVFPSDLGIETDNRQEIDNAGFIQFKNRFIITTVKSGLMLIDQHKAHSRILYEKYLANIKNKRGVSQKLLFPETLQLNELDTLLLEELMEALFFLGFEIDKLGPRDFVINGVPSELKGQHPEVLLENIISSATDGGRDFKEKLDEELAALLAGNTAIQEGQKLSVQEMEDLVNQLFACVLPNYAPKGGKVLTIIQTDELEGLF